MTKLIALSGPWNTGKTTLQKKIVERLQEEGYTVLFFPESARIAMKWVWTDDMASFQNQIQLIESERSEIIQASLAKNLYDLIICDRTWMEQNAYLIYNIMQQKINSTVNIEPQPIDYDKIYYFDTPIKTTTTEEFTHYNNNELNDLMWRMVKGRFGDSARLYGNGMIHGDKVLQDILDLIQS